MVSRRLPAGAGQFVLVAVVAELHHVVDPHAAVAVVVVVALPDACRTNRRSLPSCCGSSSRAFRLRCRPDCSGRPFPPGTAGGWRRLRCPPCRRRVLPSLSLSWLPELPKLKYSLPSGPKTKAWMPWSCCVPLMPVNSTSLLVGLVVAVFVGEENTCTLSPAETITRFAQDADAVGRVDVAALIEDLVSCRPGPSPSVSSRIRMRSPSLRRPLWPR
jgi:hypothetical protein